MTAVMYLGLRVAGVQEAVHCGRGRLYAYLASHDQISAQAVIFYDSVQCSGVVLHKIYVSPQQSPTYIRFGRSPGKEEGLLFENGLSINAGNCELAVWAVGYE